MLQPNARLRGIGTTEVLTIVGLIGIALIAGEFVVGDRMRADLNQTANEVGSPNALPERFGGDHDGSHVPPP